MPPLVGVTFRFPPKAEPYLHALRLAGVEPVPIRPDEPRAIDGLSGLLLTGGTDVDPALYGKARIDAEDHPDRERDDMESALLNQALRMDIPIFGICRGMQLWNVVAGGSLHQHIEGHRHGKAAEAHDVEMTPGTLLNAILGISRATVNSRHHQAVDRVGDGLMISATAPDGIIEALEIPGRRFAVAVQWHPEDLVESHAHASALFEAFANAVRNGAGYADAMRH